MDKIEKLTHEIHQLVEHLKGQGRRRMQEPESGYLNIEDLLPSYGRKKFLSADDSLIITVDTVIDFSSNIVQQVLEPNPQRCFIFAMAATAGPFYLRMGSDPAVGQGIILPNQFANFERHSKTHWIHKGPWSARANATSDSLIIIEGSNPGGKDLDVPPFRPNGRPEYRTES